MENQQINDAVHIQIGYGAETPDGGVLQFPSFGAVKMYVRENGLKSFFAFDKDNRANIVKIKAIYMDRYRESDIEDRLIANKQQGGKSFFVRGYKDERKSESEQPNEYNDGEKL